MSPRGVRSTTMPFLSETAFRAIMEDKPAPSVVALPPRIELQRCDVCHEYLPAGSKRLGQCLACGAFLPRPRIITPTITREYPMHDRNSKPLKVGDKINIPGTIAVCYDADPNNEFCNVQVTTDVPMNGSLFALSLNAKQTELVESAAE